MLQSPLAIEIATSKGARHFTARDLSFSTSARGGFEAANFDLPAYITTADPALTVESRCTIYDTRNGRTVFQGYLGEPGRAREDSSGHVWQVGVVGAQSVLADRALAHIVIDRDLTAFDRGESGSAPGATTSAASLPTDETVPALLMQFPSGQPIDNGTRAVMRYSRMRQAGQDVGGFGYDVVSGINSANYEAEATTSPSLQSINTFTASTTPGHKSNSVGGTSWATTTDDRLNLRWKRVAGGATNVSTDDNYAAFYNFWIRPKLRLQDGTYLTGTSTYADIDYLLAHQAIIDALWRFTNMVDIANASIDTSFTHHIDQMAYPEGVRLPDMLGDIALLEPDITWKVGPVGANGLHSFTVTKYPTTIRYEADTRDGWSSPGGEGQIANSITVFWTDKNGDDQTSTYTTTSPGLDQWGRVRDAEEIHLSTEVGSQAAADRIGAAFLDQLNTRSSAGTLTVARPIRDLLYDRWVMPWEVEPGYLINVRDTFDPPMRITQMSYQDSDQSAQLTLGTPTYSPEELANKLARRRNRKGGAKVPITYA